MKSTGLVKANLSRLSSIGIGGVVELFIIDSDEYPSSRVLIAGATNILFSPTPPPLMKLSKKFSFIKITDQTLHIGAATPNGRVVSFCRKHNIANFEFLSHLPGTIGGAIKMNAGLKEYETSNYLLSFRTKHGWIDADKAEFLYRYSDIKDVIFEAKFTLQNGFDERKIELFKGLRVNQPKEPSAGSLFKNPPQEYAGKLIELVGLKGYRIADMAFSDRHANFLVNLGEGTYQDAITLIELAKKRVLQRYDIELELEVIVL